MNNISTEHMTLREYAAIKLKVPDSGVDWLDMMIYRSLRNDFAAQIMQGKLMTDIDTNSISSKKYAAEEAFKLADAMMEVRTYDGN